MFTVRDHHRYFLPALERQAAAVKGKWLLHLERAYMLLREQAPFGPQYSNLGPNLGGVAHLITREEAKLASIQAADDAAHRAAIPKQTALKLAADRLGFLANWLENTHAPGSQDARNARLYAEAAMAAWQKGGS